METNSVRPTGKICLFTSEINKDKSLKDLSYLSFFHFIGAGLRRGNGVRTSGNSGYFQDGRTFLSKLPAFKILLAFVVLTLFKLPDPGVNIS